MVYNQQLGKEYRPVGQDKVGISSKLAATFTHLDPEIRSRASALINPSFLVLVMSPTVLETDIENSTRILVPHFGQLTLDLNAFSHEQIPEGKRVVDTHVSLIRVLDKMKRARLETFSSSLHFKKCQRISKDDPSKVFYFTKPSNVVEDPLTWPKLGVKFDHTLEQKVMSLPHSAFPDVLVYKSPTLEAAHSFATTARKNLPKQVSLHVEVSYPVTLAEVAELRRSGFERVQIGGSDVLQHGPYLLKRLM